MERKKGWWEMLNEENKTLCRMVFEKHGFAKQTIKLAEECSELTHAITRMAGGDSSEEILENFAEELVDVRVVLEQILPQTMTEEEENARAHGKLIKALKE